MKLLHAFKERNHYPDIEYFVYVGNFMSPVSKAFLLFLIHIQIEKFKFQRILMILEFYKTFLTNAFVSHCVKYHNFT